MIECFSIITLVSLVIINLGIISDKKNVKDIGIVMFVVVLLFGWIFLGIIIPINDVDVKISPIMAQSEKEYIITDSIDNEYVFDKQIDFNNISDTTTFYLNKSTNMYHFNANCTLYYKLGDMIFKSKR
jgi:ABC-type transport system involved in multi-copper enzyme maturation permease subunit